MNRFFVEKSNIADGQAVITGDDVDHISRVLRLKKDDHVELCDGESHDYEARIISVERDGVRLELLSGADSPSEPAYRVTLFQGLPKGDKLETIIQKSVELGVYAVAPFAAERSVVRLSKAEFEKKRPRYQRVALEAAKQSRRGIVPKVLPLTELSSADLSAFDALILPYEEEHTTFISSALSALRRDARIAVFIGPEGGFEPAEAALLQARGAVSVSLGPRILRTETAGPAVLSMLVYALEGRV